MIDSVLRWSATSPPTDMPKAGLVDLDELLGIDHDDPRDRLADYIVSADEDLIRDLIERRRSLGLTQTQLAERMGINKSNVSRIERGDGDLLQSTLRRLAMALDVAIVHELHSIEDLDGQRKAHRYFGGAASRWEPQVPSIPGGTHTVERVQRQEWQLHDA